MTTIKTTTRKAPDEYLTSAAQRKASQKYAASHKEGYNARMKKYYDANKEHIKKRRMARYYINKEKKRIAVERVAESKKANEDIEKADMLFLTSL